MQPPTAVSDLADYEITSDLTRVDWPRVHAWLASSYWTPGISLERVKRAAENSALVLSAFKDGTQAAYLRVVSDRTRFAYLCDVWVDTGHRGKGLARHLVQTALNHPDFTTCNWLLATLDAHRVYEKLCFTPLPNPERFMVKGAFGPAPGADPI
jgi:GNAT superfamily N-acetyltransferase